MDGTPAPCRPRVSKGRPRTADNVLWELDIRAMELREMWAVIGPSLRAMQRCHPREVSYVASRIARAVRQDYHRRQ